MATPPAPAILDGLESVHASVHPIRRCVERPNSRPQLVFDESENADRVAADTR
jgi:hypothetical protein